MYFLLFCSIPYLNLISSIFLSFVTGSFRPHSGPFLADGMGAEVQSYYYANKSY